METPKEVQNETQERRELLQQCKKNKELEVGEKRIQRVKQEVNSVIKAEARLQAVRRTRR